MTRFKPAAGMAASCGGATLTTGVNERIRVSAIYRPPSIGDHAKMKNDPLATLNKQEMTKNLLLFIYQGF
ncbi:hypothetical protein AFK68_02400 [Hydrocoleum sp. CS-953]|nr:hypothetical protein AFK68_02400 [Hydrocoleum sp. CS-953]